jgi:5-methylcytosine-specific restriction endonuclease McrA
MPRPARRSDASRSIRATMNGGGLHGVVLVLNQDYEPLNVTNLPRAFRLVFGLRAEVLEYDHQVIRTVRQEFHAPSVIRLQHRIKRPRPRVKLTRREVFARDRHTCQYCGRQAADLTLDHIVPRHRGGSHSWDNLVAACKSCNHRKGGKTPDEARVRLLRQPFEPRSDLYSMFTPYLSDQRNEPWRTYLFLGRN